MGSKILPKKKPKQIKKAKMSSKKTIEKADFCGYEWIELFPKGVVVEGDQFVFILEDKEQKNHLPLRFPIQGSDILALPNMISTWKKSLTTVNEVLLPKLAVKLQRCVFLSQPEGRPKVKVFFTQGALESCIESDFTKVLGLCIEARLPFYATRSFIQQAKTTLMDPEIILQNQGWTEGRQKYLM